MSSTSYPHDPHVDARKKLDEEINQLEARLLVLKSARNELAPITRIHPEILQEIFFLVHYTSEHKGSAALLVTWISHKWRELAHNTSALWSQIDFKNPEWVEVALSRTKNRELEFSLNSLKRIKNSLVPLIPYTLGNLSRIKKLKIASRHGRTSMTIPEDTPEWLNPAPRLEDLRLQGLTLPPNVFSGQTPCLTSLSLNSCTHDWDTLFVFRGLKSLSIAYPVSHSTIDSIIKILELNGPHIEEVRLQNVFFSDGVAPSNSSLGKVRLEKLKYLKLEDDESTSIARFFHYLAFPPHRMNIEIETLESAELSLVPSLISARNLEKWPIHHLEIKVESDHACLRITEDWPNGNELADELDDVDTQSHIQIDIMTVDDPQQLLPLLILFPIHPIERVSFMGGHSEPQNPIILEYMGKLETIRELSLELPFLETFVVLTDQEGEKLQSAVDEGTLADIGGTQDVENTNLARTILSFHGLRHLDIYGRSQDRYILTSHDLLNLKTWLEWRKRFNFQLEKLSISGLTTPPISWLSGVFDGLVGEFQTENLNELESEDGALII